LCVVPTHFFGIPADIDKLRTKLRGSGIMIVEDAAQAMGGIHNGKFLGTQGDAGFFSLSRGKAITSIEGGIIVTDDPRLASVLRAQIASLSSYGPFQQLKLLFSACALWLFLRPRLFWFPKLLPFVNFGETVFDPDFPLRRMSGLQAGLLRKWRKKLKLFSDMRMKVSELWSALPTTALDGHRRGPYAMEKGSLIRYPVFFKNQTIRDTLLSLSNKYGWGITRVYREPVTTIKALQIAENEKKAPGAQACAETLLTLPNHGFVTTNDVSRIEQCISHLQNNKKNNFPGIPK
jgi:dTDP-4-amino-4,6-dideoxygalactose transaminase